MADAMTPGMSDRLVRLTLGLGEAGFDRATHADHAMSAAVRAALELDSHTAAESLRLAEISRSIAAVETQTAPQGERSRASGTHRR